jgi:hypothetical protein
MEQNPLTRRRFVVYLAAFSGLAGTALQTELFSSSRAWAESTGPVDEPVRQSMVRMARLLYPHDALTDEVYAGVLDSVLSDAAGSTEFERQLESTASALDRQSGGSWHRKGALEQIAAMRAIEAEPFFVAIQNQVCAGIYNGQAFWKHVGYPGPSKGFGGYLRRGAGEIDWLPGEK